MNDDFFKDKYFAALADRLEGIEKKLTCVQTDVNSINLKVNYMYGFAAGIAFIFSIAINWVVNMWKSNT